jgi:hypothetical protein
MQCMAAGSSSALSIVRACVRVRVPGTWDVVAA